MILVPALAVEPAEPAAVITAAAVKPPPMPLKAAAKTSAVPQGKAVISYQAPPVYSASSGVRRDNKLILAPVDMPFPNRCVKCNQPVAEHEMKKATMYWQHPAYYATLLLGLLIGAIILLLVRKKTEVTYGICNVHRAKRRNMVLIGWLIALAGLGLLVLSFLSMGSDDWRHSPLVPFAVIGGIVLLLTSLVWAVVAVSVISVRKIDGNQVWFAGAGEEFLSSLS